VVTALTSDLSFWAVSAILRNSATIGGVYEDLNMSPWNFQRKLKVPINIGSRIWTKMGLEAETNRELRVFIEHVGIDGAPFASSYLARDVRCGR